MELREVRLEARQEEPQEEPQGEPRKEPQEEPQHPQSRHLSWLEGRPSDPPLLCCLPSSCLKDFSFWIHSSFWIHCACATRYVSSKGFSSCASCLASSWSDCADSVLSGSSSHPSFGKGSVFEKDSSSFWKDSSFC